MTDSTAKISAALSTRYGIGQADADKFVSLMFDVLYKGIEDEGVVKVKGLGTFKLTEVSTRESVDVNTGERIVIDGHDKITFVPDVVLRDRVNSPFAQFETVVVNDGVDFSGIGKPDNDAHSDNHDESLKTAENVEHISVDVPVREADKAMAAQEDHVANISHDEHQEANLDKGIGCEQTTECACPTEHMSAVASKLTDASDKLSTASDKLSTASSKLSDVSEKLSEASGKLSDSSQKISDTATQGVGQPGDTKQLADTIVVVNDLRNRLCEMKEQNFVCTNENRKLKNANINLQRSLRNMRIALWSLAGVLVAAVVASWAFGYAWCEMSYLPMDEHYNSTPAEASAAVNVQPKTSAAKETQNVKSLQKASDTGTANGNDNAVKKATAVCADARETRRDNSAEDRQQPVATSAQRATTQSAEHAPVVASTRAAEPAKKNSTVASDSYDADPRVRTGAYRIVGVAHVVTVRKGQTLATISRTYLGNGMECYVEALNGKDVKEGDKVKIPKLELKKKKQ